MRLGALASLIALMMLIAPAAAQDSGSPRDPPRDPMTLERLDALVHAAADEVLDVVDGRVWRFTVAQVPVTIVTDTQHDRMRVIVPIARVSDLSPQVLERLMQANFDTALDARYAIAQEILWAAFIHPLSPLTDAQLLSGIGQTVNLARTFGGTYSSGELTYGGGDSEGLLERQLIDELLKRGGVI